MGFAMAKRLLAAGHEVSVYNRTRSKVEPLAALGATIVDSPRALRKHHLSPAGRISTRPA